MLKLPKGLKKKKKGKKSKKNQELFTEEELETYKREQREKQLAEEAEKSSDTNKQTDDDEWSRFNALTTGIDTVLKKTQGDLDRIKESSFFQRVTPKRPELPKKEIPIETTSSNTAGAEQSEASALKEPETEADRLAQAVIELSESEEESDDGDDIFDTTYIDVIASGEVPLAYVQDSPTEDVDVGPDPFDTSYAEQVVKGPEVSKRGKKIVNIGSAVEVLTGRVENRSTVTARRPRRGPQNLLLESFEDSAGDTITTGELDEVSAEPIIVKTLLDDTDDDFFGGPIDLSVSLHIALQKEQQPEQKPKVSEENSGVLDILSEFDVLNKDINEDDEFAELAAESLTKKEEIQKLSQPQIVEGDTVRVSEDWAAFSGCKESEQKVKPVRPQLPCITKKLELEEEESEIDPFDTTFVEKVLPEPEDFDFDPRAEERKSIETSTVVASPVKIVKDLLAGSNPDLTNLTHIPIIPTESFDQQEIDPFDTSTINSIVLPKETEIKFLEKELLTNKIHQSLSDPDFDPRAEEETVPELKIRNDYQETARRKSSLSLNIGSTTSHKSVVFVNKIGGDLLSAVDDYSTGNGKIQKPLTPYYNNQPSIEEKESEDPFDTSFVANPSAVEISLLERDLLAATTVGKKLSHSLSDPDFDPRGVTPEQEVIKPDLLAVSEEHNIKVLTPATGAQKSVVDKVSEIIFVDPFDTSAIDHNILPGRAELKLLESELLPTSTLIKSAVLDTYTDSEELGLGDKVLTPYLSTQDSNAEDIDPFDTSFASNLAPGSAEIKVLEKQLID